MSLVARFGHWIRRGLLSGLGLLALALVSGSLGNLSRSLNGVLAVAALLGLALLWPRSSDSMSPWRWGPALVTMAGSLLLVARGEPLGLFGVALFIFALSLLPLEDTGIATALQLTSLFFALYRLLVTYIPALWHLEQSLSVTFSWLVGVGLMLGPTALGTPLFFLFSFYASSVLLLTFLSPSARTQWLRPVLVFIAWLLGLVLVVGAYIWLQPPLGSILLTYWPTFPTPSFTPAPPPTLTYLESQPLLSVLLWLVSALASLALRPPALPLTPAPRTRGWAAVGLGLLALATLALTLEPPVQPRRGAILFYDTGHLDWKLPTFGQYGPHSSGDFGLWPDYLAAYGYETRVGQVSEENLAGTQAVVLISPPDFLPNDEKARLLAFVENGGGLIVVGEHTGIDRIREPINDLLADVPIRLKFDSAVPSRLGWSQGLALLPHPATAAAPDPMDMVIAVGASLQIDPPARPIVVGRFGHSDAGDVNNRAMNYVGDMRYNSGERLGDVVLIAEADYGQGRIVVMGDTTPLGSVNLMTSIPFLIRLMNSVTARQPTGWQTLLYSSWLGLLLLLAASACLALGKSRVTLAGAALVMVLALILTTRLNVARSTPPLPSGPIAIIDASHQERFNRMLWEPESIGGLNYNLVRNGALPFLLREIDGEVLAKADLLVVIAPGGRFSAQEVETIADWVANGGQLLVSVGWEESEASQDLLAPFGLAVDHIPLGPVEVQREGLSSPRAGLVRFHEAWPVRATYGDARTIIEGYGYPLVVYQPWGHVDPESGRRGGVILIGDSQFLLSGALEGEDTYNEGNIFLLRDILQETLTAGRAPTPGDFKDRSGEGP